MTSLKIINGLLLTQDATRTVRVADIYVKDGEIMQIADHITAQADRVIDAKGALVLPGLINAHVHLGESIYMSKIAHRLMLERYLNETEEIAERHRSKVEVARELIATYSLAELVRAGTTTIAGGRTANVAGLHGVRNVSGYMMMSHGKLSKYKDNAPQQLKETILRDSSLLTTHAIFIHSLATVSPEDLGTIAGLREVLPGCRTMLHLAETQTVTATTRSLHGQTEINLLRKMDLLNDRTLAVHGCNLSQQEIRVLHDTGVRLVHCLSSNMSASDCTLSARTLNQMGSSLVIGTDGAITSGSFSVLHEAARVYMYQNQFKSRDTFSAQAAFDAITINAAHSLGLGDQVGSIECGKRADLTIVRLPADASPRRAVDTLIYYAHLAVVETVLIDGEVKLYQGKLIGPLATAYQPFYDLTAQLSND